MSDGIGHYGIQVSIATKETRAESFGHTQHVSHYQYLSVYSSTGSDSDNRNSQLLSHTGCQCCRNFLQYQSEASGFFQQTRILNQLFSFCVFFGAYTVSSVFIDRLRHQSQVSHHGHSGTDDTANHVDDFFTTFQLQGISMCFFHDADSIAHPVKRVCLIRTKWHIHHYQCTLHTAHH